MTGVWAIEVYPITSGIAIAASVTPAMTSVESQLALYSRSQAGRSLEVAAMVVLLPSVRSEWGILPERAPPHAVEASSERDDLAASPRGQAKSAGHRRWSALRGGALAEPV